jgi:hypothetical protein
MAYDLFISHSEADRAWVEGFLLDGLTKAGLLCLSESSFRLGAPKLQEFQRAISQSTHILLVISPAYLSDDVSQFVDLLAQSYGQDTQTWPVIPLVLQPTVLPPRLSMLVGLRATTSAEQEAALNRLCVDLRHPLAPASLTPHCPYPGMVPFSEAQQDSFYGREREITELLDRLRAHPFVTVIGPSGSGKSSLVFAGLLPRLRQSTMFGSGEWVVISMRPGIKPVETLANELAGDPTNLAATIQQLLDTGDGSKKRLLLIIDQYEELFTLGGPQKNTFELLIKEVVGMSGCYVVLTVRADFYADLMESPLWHDIQTSRMEVLPLDDEGLREAILRPAERVEVFIEPALIERLIDDAAGEPGALPLVQETLVLMWERIERRFLPLRAYEALVLPVGAYSGTHCRNQGNGLQVAIALRADAALASLRPKPEEQKSISRDLLLRLVQFGEGRADTRRSQRLSDLVTVHAERDLFDQTLKHLIDCRLLTSDKDEGSSVERRIDIAHEALIQCWPNLQTWIAEKRESEIVRRKLSDKAREWKRLGSAKGGLLDAVEISEAERWRASCSDLDADPQLNLFLDNSRRAVEQQQLRGRQAFGTMVALLVLGVLALGIARLREGERNTFKTMLEVQLGNKPTSMAMILPSLDTYLDEARGYAKKAAADPDPIDSNDAYHSYREQGIANARAVLDTVYRVENGNYKLSQHLNQYDSNKLKRLKDEAEGIMDELILPFATVKIGVPLRSKMIGRLEKPTTWLRYEEKFTKGSALEATYQVIMLDLGADINRIGTLSRSETRRIPCSLLLLIDRLWQRETGDCGWYGPRGSWSGRTACTKGSNNRTDNSLGALIFPDISYTFIRERLDACGVNNSVLN